MAGNLIRRQVRDRNGRWVTRWVRPDTPEKRTAPVPPAVRPEHSPSPRHQRWQQACLDVLGHPIEARTMVGRNLWLLAEHEPRLLEEIAAQCASSPSLRAVWNAELNNIHALTGGGPGQNKAAAAEFRPLVREYPRIVSLLERTGQGDGADGRYIGHSVRSLHKTVSMMAPDAESPSKSLYLMCIASRAAERAEYGSPPITVGFVEQLVAQAEALEGRADELALIVPELLRRGTTEPEVVDALLGTESAALRDGAI